MAADAEYVMKNSFTLNTFFIVITVIYNSVQERNPSKFTMDILGPSLKTMQN